VLLFALAFRSIIIVVAIRPDEPFLNPGLTNGGGHGRGVPQLAAKMQGEAKAPPDTAGPRENARSLAAQMVHALHPGVDWLESRP
jgi:hypothetical protein